MNNKFFRGFLVYGSLVLNIPLIIIGDVIIGVWHFITAVLEGIFEMRDIIGIPVNIVKGNHAGLKACINYVKSGNAEDLVVYL